MLRVSLEVSTSCQGQGVEDVDMRSRVSVRTFFRSQTLADKTSILLVWFFCFLHVLYPCFVNTALHQRASQGCPHRCPGFPKGVQYDFGVGMQNVLPRVYVQLES